MNKTEETPKKYAAPAIDAMLDILEYMAAENRPCGVTEMSRSLGISTNLAFRIMKRLVERGYAESTPACSYKLSTRFFSLGMKLYSQFELRRRARPHMEALAAFAGTTVQLQVPDSDAMLVREVITPDAPFFIQVVPGTKLNYHCNAFGKLVLAFSPDDFAEKVLPARLEPMTSNSIRTRKQLEEELDLIRRRGVAYDNEEYTLGIFCIGAPLFDVNGIILGGLGVTGLTSTFSSARRSSVIQKVLECAASVSADIGYTGGFFDSVNKLE